MDEKHDSVSEGFIEVTQKTWLPQIRMSREESLNENGSGGAKNIAQNDRCTQPVL